MEEKIITKEIIVRKFMEELDVPKLIPISKELTSAINNYITCHTKHLNKKPVSEMQRIWLEKDQKRFDSTINLLNLWSKLRKLKEMKIEL